VPLRRDRNGPRGGLSPVTRAEIDAFAELSGDHQWIHVDPERAKAEIRFPAPVPIDTRVRAKAEVVSVEEVGSGWWQVVTRFTLEAEVAENAQSALAILTALRCRRCRERFSTPAGHCAGWAPVGRG
jgi:acyl dehydratase